MGNPSYDRAVLYAWRTAIGIDVGGILYELLRSKSDWGPRNPTIGPPVQKLSDTFH